MKRSDPEPPDDIKARQVCMERRVLRAPYARGSVYVQYADAPRPLLLV